MMLPVTPTTINIEQVERIPTYTYRLDLTTKRITGHVDGLDAMIQALQKILETERFAYEIYTARYGREFDNLFGDDIDFAKSVLESRIQDAILADDRVKELVSFDIINEGFDSLEIQCKISTIFGTVSLSEEVILR